MINLRSVLKHWLLSLFILAFICSVLSIFILGVSGIIPTLKMMVSDLTKTDSIPADLVAYKQLSRDQGEYISKMEHVLRNRVGNQRFRVYVDRSTVSRSFPAGLLVIEPLEQPDPQNLLEWRFDRQTLKVTGSAIPKE